MKLFITKEIGAPVAFVFEAITEFERFEAAAVARGVKVDRRATGLEEGANPVWDIQFSMHGKALDLSLEVSERAAPHDLAASIVSKSFRGNAECHLSECGDNKTHLALTFAFQGETLAGRLFLKTLDVTKAALQQKIEARVTAFATEVESDYRAAG